VLVKHVNRFVCVVGSHASGIIRSWAPQHRYDRRRTVVSTWKLPTPFLSIPISGCVCRPAFHGLLLESCCVFAVICCACLLVSANINNSHFTAIIQVSLC